MDYFGSHHDQLYLVIELIDGWSLAPERSLHRVHAPAEARPRKPKSKAAKKAEQVVGARRAARA